MSGRIKALNRKQKLFLQRLLASHILSTNDATELYNSIMNMSLTQTQDYDGDNEQDEEGLGRNLDHCLGLINASLVPAFRLEIRTISLPTSYCGGGEGDEEEVNGGSGGYQRYHAIVNLQSDGPAKNHAASTFGPHDLAFTRVAIEHIVEDDLEREQQRIDNEQEKEEEDNDDEEEEDDDGDKRSSIGSRRSTVSSSKKRKKPKKKQLATIPSVGCTGALTRVDLLNLRSKLAGPHENKLNIRDTERVIDRMLEEGWLVIGPAPRNYDNDKDEEEEEDKEEEELSSPRKKKRHQRKSPRKSTGGNTQNNKQHYWIGPRTYMECPELLTDLGICKERMPQFILHHA
mmetsp:Transcript_3372/g.4955  ORF Transcript_3372/g.4955 Transcript_3372/m.4955 type:complete len:345 (-) Transcript_3372:848-1882(-)